MAIFGFFRRRPPIRKVAELADFIDEQSAYLVQRYIYDYTQARSGPYSKSLLIRPDFMQAVERSRWSAYPLGLAMVGEMVEGVLRPHAGDERQQRGFADAIWADETGHASGRYIDGDIAQRHPVCVPVSGRDE